MPSKSGYFQITDNAQIQTWGGGSWGTWSGVGWHITFLKIYANSTIQSTSTAVSTVTISIAAQYTTDNVGFSQTITIPKGENNVEVTVYPDVRIKDNINFYVAVSVSNANIKQSKCTQAYYAGGKVGDTASGDRTGDTFVAYEIRLTYDYFWYSTLDNGYLAPTSETAIDEFRFFETDTNGLTLNASAWKFDSRNDGYGWIVTAEDANIGNRIYIKTDEGFSGIILFEKAEENNFNPLFVFYKESEDNADTGDIVNSE